MEIGTTRNGISFSYKPQQTDIDFTNYINKLNKEDLYDTFIMFQVITIKMKRHKHSDLKDWGWWEQRSVMIGAKLSPSFIKQQDKLLNHKSAYDHSRFGLTLLHSFWRKL